ncbi:MAG TPA: cytochrome c3 family protein, partial [Candidatus Limnocylindrales bacterium]
MIGPDGGTISAGDVTLSVPPGAVGAPSSFWIDRASVADPEAGVSLYGFVFGADDATGAAIQTFGAPIEIVVDASGWDLAGTDPSRLAIAELIGGSWATVGIGTTRSLKASIDHSGTFAVQGQLLPADVLVELSSDAPAGGRHRIEPASPLTVSIAVRIVSRLETGSLVATIPNGWQVIDDGGGSFDGAASTLSWNLRSLAAGTTARRSFGVRAPPLPWNGSLAVEGSFDARLDQPGARLDQPGARTSAPSLGVLVAPRVAIGHVTAARVHGPDGDVVYLAPDDPLRSEPRYEVFRLRFDVRNADGVPVRWTPELEFRDGRTPAFRSLPAGQNADGVAFFAAPEWVATPAGGTAIGVDSVELPAATLGRDPADGPGQVPIDGLRSMGRNPLDALVLPPLSRSVVEFSVRATADADYLAAYDFRLTDAGEPLPGAAEALVVLEAQPALELSPGQRVGTTSGDRSLDTSPPIRFALTPQGSASADSASGANGTEPELRFALIPPGDGTGAGVSGTAFASGVGDPVHGPAYGLASDACAGCHRAHAAPGTNLTARAAPQLTLCASCHDGVTAPGVQSAYDAAPANDPTDRAYYRHEPTAIAGHDGQGADGLAGALNRHNECTDCHNPHNATSTDASPAAGGWTASGRVAGAASVTA